MDSIKAEAIARIQCDFGVDNISIKSMFGKSAILHVSGDNPTEVIFTAETEEECQEIIWLARKETTCSTLK